MNRFRVRRGRRLSKQIAEASRRLGRKVTILDVGGRPQYWSDVSLEHVEAIEIMNHDAGELDSRVEMEGPFTRVVGDARDLSAYGDGAVDFVHSNSVLEHVGGWRDMQAMAREVCRVGKAGWVQTPSFGFPVEPHFKAPFVHWFGKPVQRRLFFLSASKRLRAMSIHERRAAIDSINLVSKNELRALFPGLQMFVERVVFAKSFSVYWLPSITSS